MICGVDEVGRGPLAGPVVAAAVIFTGRKPKGLADSKVLSEEERVMLDAAIRSVAIVGLGRAEPHEIDAINIRQATFLAMRRAVEALSVRPAAILVDGADAPDLGCPVEAIIDGDACVPLIAAGSIVAKVARDAMMVAYCAAHPGYGFARHKGYAVPEHRMALARLGPSPLHRMSFKPVADAAAARAR
jgi:ribonuclease HII